MISFFRKSQENYFVVEHNRSINNSEIKKLQWLFGNVDFINSGLLKGNFIGPRKEMVTPWSTNAVEITQNIGINSITRIPDFYSTSEFIDLLMHEHEVDFNIFELKELFSKEPQWLKLVPRLASRSKMDSASISEILAQGDS